MKFTTALTLFCMANVASATKLMRKTARMVTTSATFPGAGQKVDAFPELTGTPVVTGGLQRVATTVSSSTDTLGNTVTQGTTTHESTGTQIQPGIPGDGYYNPSSPGGYPGYVPGMSPGFYTRDYQSYLRWAYPGLSSGLYPGFFHATQRGSLSPLYPDLLEASHHGFFGGASSRYVGGLYPGLFGAAYGSLYGSRFFGSGALERVRTYFAGYQREVAVTVDPLTGLPAPVSVPVANRVVTIERLVPFPSPYPVPVPVSYPAELPVPHPGVSTPVSSTTQIGSSTTVSQGGIVTSGLDGTAVAAGQHQKLLQTQTHLNLV